VPARSRLVAKPTGNRRKPLPAKRIGLRDVADACRRALRRAAPGLVAAGVLGLVGAGGYAGYRYLTTSPRFAIATIEVHGNQTLTDDEIRALLTVRVGENLIAADLHAETRALEAEPWIAGADVRRELPDTLVIEIEERLAAAVVALDGGTYLADDRGVPFRRCDDGALADGLPIITGLDRDAFAQATPSAPGPATVRAALAAMTAWRAVPERPAADEIHAADGALAVRTRTGLVVEVGPAPVVDTLPDRAAIETVAGRLRRFDLAWTHLSADERTRARSIHVDHQTRTDRVIVAFAAKD
jgi:cell division septal protein FtsQ